MSRSIKKGPFIDEHLLKKILEMNRQGAKKMIKTMKPQPNIVMRIMVAGINFSYLRGFFNVSVFPLHIVQTICNIKSNFFFPICQIKIR